MTARYIITSDSDNDGEDLTNKEHFEVTIDTDHATLRYHFETIDEVGVFLKRKINSQVSKITILRKVPN